MLKVLEKYLKKFLKNGFNKIRLKIVKNLPKHSLAGNIKYSPKKNTGKLRKMTDHTTSTTATTRNTEGFIEYLRKGDDRCWEKNVVIDCVVFSNG